MVRRHLAESRSQAAALIASGTVLVGGIAADKAARLVGADEPVVLSSPPPPFVGRGGQKLDAALTHFGIHVQGRRAIDVGASTGGFTDCLLQRGAASVVALDVGRGQLHERLRADQRVISMERTDVRHVDALDLGGPFDLVVADVSFISLRSVATDLIELADIGADLVVLVKPQFEAGRREVSKGKGVVRDPDVWLDALTGATSSLSAAGAAIMGVMVSPLRGADGNVEFLLHLQRSADRDRNRSVPDVIEAAVAEAAAGQAG